MPAGVRPVVFDFLRKSDDHFFCSQLGILRFSFRRWRRFWLRWLDLQAIPDYVPGRRGLLARLVRTEESQNDQSFTHRVPKYCGLAWFAAQHGLNANTFRG